MTARPPAIVVEENPDPAVREAILKPLRAFNESRVGPIKPQGLAILWLAIFILAVVTGCMATLFAPKKLNLTPEQTDRGLFATAAPCFVSRGRASNRWRACFAASSDSCRI